MKPIEELNISPWPWREASYGLIVSSDNKKVADFGNSMYEPKDQDFVIMVSAPEMYECLLEAVTCKCAACGGYDTFYCKGRECQVKKWREVLDNVSGERK